MSDIEEVKPKEVNETQAINRMLKILEPMAFRQAERVLGYLASRVSEKIEKERGAFQGPMLAGISESAMKMAQEAVQRRAI